MDATTLIFAAAEGDVVEVQRAVAVGYVDAG